MSLIRADRVWETSAPVGTSSFLLAGAKASYQTFSDACLAANGSTFEYSANDGVNWEVGIGTWTTGGHLSRTPYFSSNGNSLVNFGGATINILGVIPANYFSNPIARISREITASGSVIITAADDLIYVNKTVGQATPVSLPRNPNASLAAGQSYSCEVADARGDCNANPITITDPDGLLINKQSSIIMYVNGSSLTFGRFSTGWSIL